MQRVWWWRKNAIWYVVIMIIFRTIYFHSNLFLKASHTQIITIFCVCATKRESWKREREYRTSTTTKYWNKEESSSRKEEKTRHIIICHLCNSFQSGVINNIMRLNTNFHNSDPTELSLSHRKILKVQFDLYFRHANASSHEYVFYISTTLFAFSVSQHNRSNTSTTTKID